MEIECSSAVSRVVVHARGALVTRAVTLPPDLPGGLVDIAIPGVTIQAQPGSARAALEDSDRVVASVQASVVVTGGGTRRGPSVERLRELSARSARLDDEHEILLGRRQQLLEIAIDPSIRTHDGKERPRDAFDVRFAEAIAMSRLLAAKVSDLDQRVFAVEKEQQEVNLELEAARLSDAQTSTAERLGQSQPTRRVAVRLTGEGRPGVLLVTYAVAVARWWPTYTLRMLDAGARATWTFEALVAQKTGEDWTQALLALSSADLLFDARLPELASLRFGRQQAPKRRPLRAAPSGVEDMFAGYLAFKPYTPPPKPAPQVYKDEDEFEDQEDTGVGQREQMKKGSRTEPVPPPPRPMMAPVPARGAPPLAQPMSASFGAAPGGAAMPMMMRSRAAQPAPKSAGILGAVFDRGGGGGEMDALLEASMIAEGFIPEPELVAGAQWQNLDRLVLAGADEPKRGKLVPAFDYFAGDGDTSALDRLTKDRWIDPGDSRGMFDHRYDAAGRADVPSDGRVHRVGVETKPCNVLIAWRTVPSESLEVYREANVINPFDVALLGGPVDVYLDGSLLAETKTQRIDKGGTLWCGMGVDDRVKVARNVRADEESAGLLGGSLAVTHTVNIELSSTIKDPIKVKVLERVPVTDDKAIEVKLLKLNPPAQAYDQANRGSPVRGGYQFDATVTGGSKTQLEVVYKLVFASKLDIVGGSRRG